MLGMLMAVAVSSQRAIAAGDSIEIDRLVHDLCAKSVVMLGEDAHHAGGATVEVKSKIVLALIDRCGFDTVAFESGFYDFVDFERERSSRRRAFLACVWGACL